MDILIVEDEPAIRQMLIFALAEEGHNAFEAGNVSEAQRTLSDHKPDLILLDWMLPGISGSDFARRLKKNPKTNEIPIIMLTAKTEERDKVYGLDHGADDYVTKPFSTKELLARIHAITRRSRMAQSKVIQSGPLQIELESNRLTYNGKPVEVSPTEFRLMHYFIQNQERVFSRSQLLDAVWGPNSYIEERTVDVHIRRLRKLLEHYNCDRFIQTVRSVGYRFSLQVD